MNYYSVNKSGLWLQLGKTTIVDNGITGILDFDNKSQQYRVDSFLFSIELFDEATVENDILYLYLKETK